MPMVTIQTGFLLEDDMIDCEEMRCALRDRD